MKLRNIAIIAHVDHGKTTLVDQMLAQSGTFRENEKVEVCALDSNDLERERGITILAKCTSVTKGDTLINIVDTPGHADFGAEVERILSMVDGVILLVDAAEGPLPQTKFVVGKALARGLKPMVVINKVDRSDARADEVLDEVFDLFVALEADESQLDFPILYASGRSGWAVEELEDAGEGTLKPLFEMIKSHVPQPDVDKDAPFSMLVTLIQSDPYLGRILTGRVQTGRIKTNATVKSLGRDGSELEKCRVSRIMAYRGLKLETLDSAEAGDIVSIAGLKIAGVADTICAVDVAEALPSLPVDPPTMAMHFAVNDSPLAGLDGNKLTSRMLRDRLYNEAEGNVAIKVTEAAGSGDAFDVAGRGELQLAVLIETLRREGFELTVGRPKVLYRTVDGVKMEPMEEVVVDVDEEYSGAVVQKMTIRKAELMEMKPSGGGKQRLMFIAPTRGLIGYLDEFLTDTRGTGIMNRVFHSWAPMKGDVPRRRQGALIAMATGNTAPYALFNLEDRGVLFVDSGVKVYQGMIIGEHSRGNDLEVNVLKGRQLTNFRASGKEESVKLTPPPKMGIEEAIAWIADDEMVEVTPKHVRLRKMYLCPHDRKKHSRGKLV